MEIEMTAQLEKVATPEAWANRAEILGFVRVTSSADCSIDEDCAVTCAVIKQDGLPLLIEANTLRIYEDGCVGGCTSVNPDDGHDEYKFCMRALELVGAA